MAAAPTIRYAKAGSSHIAYQAAGEQARTLVLVVGATGCSVVREEPAAAPFFSRLASFSQLVTFDQRGTGRSDPVDPTDPPTLEDRVDELRAVVDAVGTGKFALLGTHDGGAVSMMFAATYPERVSALVLVNTWARLERAEDYPIGFRADTMEAGSRRYIDSWGTGESIGLMAPSMAGDKDVRTSWARREQTSASPGQADALMSMAMKLDTRHVLPAIAAPTLVLHSRDDAVIPMAHGQYIADHMPGAKFIELPSSDHMIMIGELGPFLDDAEEFLTGVRQVAYIDRVLSTVLFTDVVGSTAQAAEMGDRRWGELIDRHHEVVRHDLARFRGKEVGTLGDGFIAMFDGPGRAIQCARAIHESLQPLGLRVRAGLHTGECEILDSGVGGLAVHIGARVADKAEPGEVLVSSTVKDLVVGSGIRFADRGTHRLKGVPDEWHLFSVQS